MPDREWFRSEWSKLISKIKREWGQLTDEDLQEINGDADQLVNKLQARYGWPKDRTEQQIQKFIDHQNGTGQERRGISKFPPVDEEEDL